MNAFFRSFVPFFALSLCLGCPTDPDVEAVTLLDASVVCTDDGAGTVTWEVDVRVDGPVTDDGAEFEIRSTSVPNPLPYGLALVGRNGDTNVEFAGTFPGDPASGLESDVPFDCTATDLEQILCVVNREDSGSVCWACGDGSGTLPGQARAWASCD